jgi:hypothetical protein
MRRFFLGLAVLSLSGCGIARMQAQQAQIQQYVTCKQYNDFIKHVDCLHTVAAHDTVFMPYSISLQTSLAYADVLVEKIKAHKMTNAEARYAFDEKRAELANQEAQTSAMQENASAASRVAWAANRPKSTTCTGFGNSVNCTTY